MLIFFMLNTFYNSIEVSIEVVYIVWHISCSISVEKYVQHSKKD